MAFITLSNIKRIVINSDLKNKDLSGNVYKIPIYMYSKYEKNQLLAIQDLLENPEDYFKDIYESIEPIDTLRYVSEGKNPSYHNNVDCPRLNARYENFEIPEDIVKKGKDEIIKFRMWFSTVRHLLDDDPEQFAMRMHTRWGIITNPRALSWQNTGPIEVEELTIEELEKRIDLKIKQAGRFYYASTKNSSILKLFGSRTFLKNPDKKIIGNNTGYNDSEIRELLNIYDNEFKKPLTNMLIEYYRLKLNPELNMDGNLLEKLGFRKCNYCFK